MHGVASTDIKIHLVKNNITPGHIRGISRQCIRSGNFVGTLVHKIIYIGANLPHIKKIIKLGDPAGILIAYNKGLVVMSIYRAVNTCYHGIHSGNPSV